MRVGEESEVQPDAYLGILGKHGGRLNSPSNDYQPQPMELMAEVVDQGDHPTIASKLREYAKAGVSEVIVLRSMDRVVDWYSLYEEQYVHLPMDHQGIVYSEVFPGLWMDVDAMQRDDTAACQRSLNEGLQSPEHARFVAELAARRKTG